MNLSLDGADWTAVASERVVERLTDVPLAARNAAREGQYDRNTHRALMDCTAALREIEVGGTPHCRKGIDGPARILCWNVERLRHIDAIERILNMHRPDVSLLCEVDRGMARTGNADRIREISARMGQGYAYAVEFVELGLGDAREQRDHAGENNQRGFHGAALLGDTQLRRPFLIRIDARGDWFDGSRGEPRIGGTIALGAQVMVAGTAVTVVSVHLESHGDPAERADDLRRLLRQIDLYDAVAPVILGGDFNTSSASFAERWRDRPAWLARVAADPSFLVRPQMHEPLFQGLAAAGYDWKACNVPDVPTFPRARDPRPRAKLDWFFTRGLAARDPEIVPAVDANGAPCSDHDALAVTVVPQSKAQNCI